MVIELHVDDLEIFADASFSKVFANLIENALIHGKHVTVIRFSYNETENDLVLSCEDNGVGIPDGAKERIFQREYFRNTEYGLFLIVEILGITGLSIRETGTHGERGQVRHPCSQRELPFCQKDRETRPLTLMQ